MITNVLRFTATFLLSLLHIRPVQHTVCLTSGQWQMQFP